MADGTPFPVDSTTILMFASAVGDTNPIYYDEEYANGTPLGGVIAPPTFPAASAHWNPSYGFRGVRRIPKSPAVRKESGDGAPMRRPASNMARVLHGEQRFEYHKPMRPGMRLTVTGRAGKTWGKQGRRGGVLRFSESVQEFRDPDGELVVTATSVGVVTEKAVES